MQEAPQRGTHGCGKPPASFSRTDAYACNKPQIESQTVQEPHNLVFGFWGNSNFVQVLGQYLNPKPLNPKPLNPKPLNPKTLNP